jgi:hypothetical protein
MRAVGDRQIVDGRLRFIVHAGERAHGAAIGSRQRWIVGWDRKHGSGRNRIEWRQHGGGRT